jgi:hypothetical protein
MSDDSLKSAPTGAKPVSRCPICNRPADEKARPFCSSRCRDVDLHRWFSGSYVIPATEADEDDVE